MKLYQLKNLGISHVNPSDEAYCYIVWLTLSTYVGGQCAHPTGRILAEAMSRARAIAPEDLPDFVLLLLRIGMDPTLQSDTRLDMMNAIGSLDFCIASGDEVRM